MASNKIDQIDLLNTTKVNNIKIPEQEAVQGNSAVVKDVGLTVAQNNTNGWAVQSGNKSAYNNTIVNYISECEGMPKTDGVGAVFNNLIQKLGYVPNQELQQVQPILVAPTEPTEKDVKDYAAEYLNGEIAKAQKMLWDKTQNQGAISNAYSWGKDLFDTEFSKSRVGRILASEQLCTTLLTRANNLDLTKKDYFEAKLDFAMRILPKDKYSEMHIQYLQKSLESLTPEHLNSLITAVSTCNDEQYSNEVPKIMEKMISDEQKLDFQPLDSAIKSFRIENPNSVGSQIKSHDNQYILMDFEEVFLRERETTYKPEAIQDYTEKEAQMNLILAMKHKNAEIKELLHNATVTVDANNKYGAPFYDANEVCRKNLERCLIKAYKDLDIPLPLGEGTRSWDEGFINTDSYSLVHQSRELQAKLDENYNKVLGDKTFEDYQTEYSQAYKAAYGDKNGTALAEAFIESQVKGVQYVKTGVQGVGMVVMIAGQCIPVGGQVATAMSFGGITTATVGGSAVQLTEDFTKAGGMTEDDKRAIAQELTTLIALMASGMGIGKVSTLAYGELVALNCPRLLSLAGKVGVDATMSMVATQAITGQIDLTTEGISQLIPIITGVLRAKGSMGAYLNTEVQPNQLKRHFKDNNINHPIQNKIAEINKKYPDPGTLNWIQDWKLDKVDYENLATLMNMHGGKYISMWQSTNVGDISNMEKLGLLAKVLRRTGEINDISKLGTNEWEAIVNSVCSKKSPDLIDALVTYKATSNKINPPLTDKSLMTPEAQTWINSLTKYLDNSPLKNEITVYRGEGYNGPLGLRKTTDGRQIGKVMEELVMKNASDEEITFFIARELVGKRIEQDRFLSTTLSKDMAQEWAHSGAAKIAKTEFNNGAIHWEISTPAKSKGSFIEEFNVMRTIKQSEMLFQRGSTIEIQEASFDKGTNTWLIKAELIQD